MLDKAIMFASLTRRDRDSPVYRTPCRPGYLLVLLDPPMCFTACLCVDPFGAMPSRWTREKKQAFGQN
jgi:hypothetical protein